MKTIFVLAVSAISVLAISVQRLPEQVATKVTDDKPKFSKFLAEFPKVSLPYVFSEKDALASMQQMIGEERNNQPNRKYLSSKYSNFIPDLRVSTFSRMPTQPAEAMAQFALADNTIGLVYRRAYPFGESEGYTLAVMSQDGKLVKSIYLGGVDIETADIWAIMPGGKLTQQTLNVEWEKDAEAVEYDYSKNTISRLIAEKPATSCNITSQQSACEVLVDYEEEEDKALLLAPLEEVAPKAKATKN